MISFGQTDIKKRETLIKSLPIICIIQENNFGKVGSSTNMAKYFMSCEILYVSIKRGKC